MTTKSQEWMNKEWGTMHFSGTHEENIRTFGYILQEEEERGRRGRKRQRKRRKEGEEEEEKQKKLSFSRHSEIQRGRLPR